MPAARSKKTEVIETPKPKDKLVMPITLKPRISEKGYALSESLNTYIFEVPKEYNKFDIAGAVSAQFEVGVVKVRITGVPGKPVRSYRQRGRRSINSRRSGIRKAYVTLGEGDKLPIYAAVEEAEKPKESK
jgi:ribosomal protein L23